jgi:hypothetical protein
MIMTKNEAIKAVVALGYTNHFSTGESGDYGYGSRLYYKNPNVVPIANGNFSHAYISKLGKNWVVSELILEPIMIGSKALQIRREGSGFRGVVYELSTDNTPIVYKTFEHPEFEVVTQMLIDSFYPEFPRYILTGVIDPENYPVPFGKNNYASDLFQNDTPFTMTEHLEMEMESHELTEEKPIDEYGYEPMLEALETAKSTLVHCWHRENDMPVVNATIDKINAAIAVAEGRTPHNFMKKAIDK